MSQFLSYMGLFVFVIVGVAIKFLRDLILEKSDFKTNLKTHLSEYILALVIGGALAYFIGNPVVQKAGLVLAGIAFSFLFAWIIKISSKK